MTDLHAWVRVVPSMVVLAGALCGGTAMLSGCGGRSAEEGGATQATPGGNDTQAAAEAPPTSRSTGAGRPAEGTVSGSPVHVDEHGRKWLVNVPYDVFFEDPLGMAADRREVARATSGETGAGDAIPPAQAAETTPPPGEDPQSGTPWERIIRAEVLDAEVTAILNRLRQRTQTLASYNSSHLELPPHIQLLAILTAIAMEHPGEIRWKDRSKPVRDLAAQMAREPLRQGPQSHRAVQEPLELIGEIMSGSLPAGLPEVPEEQNFAELGATFQYMMLRLEGASNWLQVNVGTEEALKENRDEVEREGSLIAVLGTVIAAPEFDYALFDDFHDYAKNLTEGGRTMAEAAASENFSDFERGRELVRRSCVECHGVFR